MRSACSPLALVLTISSCATINDPINAWDQANPCAPRTIPYAKTTESELQRDGRDYTKSSTHQEYIIDKTASEKLRDVGTRVFIATIGIAAWALYFGSIGALEHVSNKNGGSESGYGGDD